MGQKGKTQQGFLSSIYAIWMILKLVAHIISQNMTMLNYLTFTDGINVSDNYPCADRPQFCRNGTFCVDKPGDKSRCEKPQGTK